jgi:ABC-type antimicrobial peptide transport system permease subunit
MQTSKLDQLKIEREPEKESDSNRWPLSAVLLLIGAGLAWLAFDGFRAATLNWASFSAITFAFDVNVKLLAQRIIFAMIIGLIGGLFPAIRAARQPISHALREL